MWGIDDDISKMQQAAPYLTFAYGSGLFLQFTPSNPTRILN